MKKGWYQHFLSARVPPPRVPETRPPPVPPPWDQGGGARLQGNAVTNPFSFLYTFILIYSFIYISIYINKPSRMRCSAV